jgi:hypothetical protein
MSILDKVEEYLSDSFKNGDRVIIKGKESGKNIWESNSYEKSYQK